MVDGASSKGKQQPSSSGPNKSFNDQSQSKVNLFSNVFHSNNSIQIVLRRLPASLTSEQFLEIVSPLPDYDYYRFCKADLRYGGRSIDRKMVVFLLLVWVNNIHSLGLI